MIGKILENCMKETQSDGTRKFSWFRIGGIIWFWIVCIPAAYLSFFHGYVIQDGLVYLTGIIILGVVGGKAVTSLQSAVTQINMKGGG